MKKDRIMQIAVLDCEENARRELAERIRRILAETGIPHRISLYGSGQALLSAVKAGFRCHILFSEAETEDCGIMEPASLLRSMDCPPQTVFVSARPELAPLGYEISAQRFLVKPVQEEKLREALSFLCRRAAPVKDVLVPAAEGQRRLLLADICYAEAFDRGCRFVLRGGTLVSRLRFCDVRTLLPEDAFLFCHRSYAVNIARIRSIRPYEFVLEDGTCVPVSKGRFAEIRRRFSDTVVH